MKHSSSLLLQLFITFSTLLSSQEVWSFQIYHPLKLNSASLYMYPRRSSSPTSSSTGSSSRLYAKEDMPLDELKSELTAYLKKREDANADELAKAEVGKVIGGTKGNAVLEYISGAPNKEYVIEETPDIFDYNELAKYGFSYLATPIMNAGGRREMYALMGLPEPAISNRIKKRKVVPKLKIDRTGEEDKARYAGLKVTQILDDDEMGRRLAEIQELKKKGEFVKPKLMEEDYVMPFADKRNIGPKQTPDWTPEMLDEEGRKAGQAISWARKEAAGEFKKDPFELMNIEGSLQVYSIITTLIVTFAFGNSTPKLLQTLNFDGESASILSSLQAPALAFVAASIGSCVGCAVLATQKNRSALVWGIKGFAGGPLAISQLRTLDALITKGEAEKLDRQAKL